MLSVTGRRQRDNRIPQRETDRRQRINRTPQTEPVASRETGRRQRTGRTPQTEPTPPRKRERKKEIFIPSIEQLETERKRLRRGKQYKKVLGNTIAILLVVAAVAVLIVTLFLPVLQVAGTSMEPTLENGDVIVLVKTKDFDTGQLVGLRLDGKVLLKRIIGGPGDWINIDTDGNVYVNGELLEEPYITDKARGETDLEYPYQVPDNCYFVMGDHRSVSVDSRNSKVGCVPYDQIIGRVLFRIWPLSRISGTS